MTVPAPVFDVDRRGARVARWLVGRGSFAGLAGLIAMALALAACVASLWQLRMTNEALAATPAIPPLAAPSNRGPGRDASTRPQRLAWNAVARQLNMPWAQMLDALEQATPPDVALVAIEPESREATVRVQAEALALEPLLAYAQALRATGAFAEASLLKHETNEQDPQRPVRMTLLLRLPATGRAN